MFTIKLVPYIWKLIKTFAVISQLQLCKPAELSLYTVTIGKIVKYRPFFLYEMLAVPLFVIIRVILPLPFLYRLVPHNAGIPAGEPSVKLPSGQDLVY